MKSVCVFCGSSSGSKAIYREVAAAMGQAIAKRGMRLIYGAGNIGLMGIVADAAIKAGGEVIGVIPQFLVDKEVAHFGLTEMIIVNSMHERKARMADLADAFVALPGGFGTFEELCEVLTWSQLGLHNKPCGILNVANYYDPLLALFDHAVTERFLRSEYRSLVVSATDVEDMLKELESYRHESLQKWMDRDKI
ncbi:MAG: hypothetical protein RLY14_683 [Planctomycetota bacterium]|jgi:uncharacterized protein (TIGR00730 family)